MVAIGECDSLFFVLFFSWLKYWIYLGIPLYLFIFPLTRDFVHLLKMMTNIISSSSLIFIYQFAYLFSIFLFVCLFSYKFIDCFSLLYLCNFLFSPFSCSFEIINSSKRSCQNPLWTNTIPHFFICACSSSSFICPWFYFICAVWLKKQLCVWCVF